MQAQRGNAAAKTMGKGSAAAALPAPAGSPGAAASGSPGQKQPPDPPSPEKAIVPSGTDVKGALHAIAKAEETSLHEIPFHDVPPELLCAARGPSGDALIPAFLDASRGRPQKISRNGPPPPRTEATENRTSGDRVDIPRAGSAATPRPGTRIKFVETPRASRESPPQAELDLRTWSMLVQDKTCKTLIKATQDREAAFVDNAMKELKLQQIAAAPPPKKADGASAAAAALSDARRRARLEAYEDQRRKQEADARAAFQLKAHEEVGLHVCRAGGASKLGDAGVARLAKGAPRLETLDLRGAKLVRDVALREVALHCAHLKHLDLGDCTALQGAGLAALGQRCPLLTVVSLAGCGKAATGWAIAGLVAGCGPSLARLDLSRCSLLSDYDCSAVAKACPALTYLRRADVRAATPRPSTWIFRGDEVRRTPRLRAESIGPREGSAAGRDAAGPALDSAARSRTARAPLRYLDLSHCRQVGDQGAVAVADHCRRLEVLLLARSELPHKLTDVALLSVAEGCGKTLRRLDLRGCEHVTDVGVSWVAHQAGATLEVFLLRDCNRVTNAGCRAIADHCHVLKSVDLRGARRVTDVGVRVLGAALGETLDELDLGGMHLVTDGVDRGFGFEGLLALAQDVRRLKKLHLDGCFQVSQRTLVALSKGCRTLVELGLAGCPRLTADGVGALVSASKDTIERVTLARCGDCVNDDLVVQLAKGAPFLKHLSLKDCERFGQPGARAIARHCKRLYHLDLAGCAGLDDEAVNCFAECRWRYPGLRHLILDKCPKFGDIGLAWLVEGPGSKALVTLAMYRCSCTSAALKSSRDYFPNSEMTRENDFFGYKPKERWEHRLLIHEFARHRRGIVKIQSAWRALRGRRVAKELRDLRSLARATLVLQKHWRGWRGRVLSPRGSSSGESRRRRGYVVGQSVETSRGRPRLRRWIVCGDKSRTPAARDAASVRGE